MPRRVERLATRKLIVAGKFLGNLDWCERNGCGLVLMFILKALKFFLETSLFNYVSESVFLFI